MRAVVMRNQGSAQVGFSHLCFGEKLPTEAGRILSIHRSQSASTLATQPAALTVAAFPRTAHRFTHAPKSFRGVPNSVIHTSTPFILTYNSFNLTQASGIHTEESERGAPFSFRGTAHALQEAPFSFRDAPFSSACAPKSPQRTLFSSRGVQAATDRAQQTAPHKEGGQLETHDLGRWLLLGRSEPALGQPLLCTGTRRSRVCATHTVRARNNHQEKKECYAEE